MQHDHIHHLHDLNHVHYDISSHDNYDPHHHVWAGNQFNTVSDHDHPFGRDFDCSADDHQLVARDDIDFEHPGYDIRWADHHSRTSRSRDNHPATGVAGDRS